MAEKHVKPEKRVGAKRMAEVTPDVLRRMNAGEIETVTIVEMLRVDIAALLGAVLPKGAAIARERIDPGAGITRRMAQAGAVLGEVVGVRGLRPFIEHPSDLVRSWCAYVIADAERLTLAQRLERIWPLADDPHSGVREWAWMALRARLAADVGASVRLLTPWSLEKSANIRRFASEATRPRGVWCSHIRELREKPSIGEPILEPLHADESKYVQDSVANWLNDASKDDAKWVTSVCARWRKKSTADATHRICKRALRTLRAAEERA